MEQKALIRLSAKAACRALKLASKSGQIDAQVRWKYTKTTPYISSVLVKDDLLYIINDGGVMICIDAQKRSHAQSTTAQWRQWPILRFASHGWQSDCDRESRWQAEPA